MAPASIPTPTIAQRLVSGWMWLLIALIVLIWPVWMALVYLVTARRDPRHPYVAVSNHESLADIFLISHLPWEMKWLSKEAIFRIPLMGG